MTTLWLILVTIWLGVVTNAIYKLDQRIDDMHFTFTRIVKSWKRANHRNADGLVGENMNKYFRWKGGTK